jgi:hypothetical protein
MMRLGHFRPVHDRLPVWAAACREGRMRPVPAQRPVLPRTWGRSVRHNPCGALQARAASLDDLTRRTPTWSAPAGRLRTEARTGQDRD